MVNTTICPSLRVEVVECSIYVKPSLGNCVGIDQSPRLCNYRVDFVGLIDVEISGQDYRLIRVGNLLDFLDDKLLSDCLCWHNSDRYQKSHLYYHHQ